MERIDLLQLYNVSQKKRRKYRLNKNRFILATLLIVMLSILSMLVVSISKISQKSTETPNYLYDIEEYQAVIDVFDINFEETVPQEVELHIPEKELEIINTIEKNEIDNGTYVVRKGDSLWSISQKFNISVHQIARLNNISTTRVLRIGQILKIDLSGEEQASSGEINNTEQLIYDGDLYTVKKGDSLWTIAQRYRIYVSTLQYINNLKKTNLTIGQKLKVSNVNYRPFTVENDISIRELSEYFNCSLDEIIELNTKYSEHSRLRKGTELLIPNTNPFILTDTKIKKFNNEMTYWPANGTIASPYGWRKHPVYGTRSFHNGVDIENVKGTNIKAVSAGKVIFASYKGNSGNLVIIQHKNGYQTIYAHLDKIIVKKGSNVKQGEIIGKMGDTGVSTGVHLHFGLRRNGKFENPMNILN